MPIYNLVNMIYLYPQMRPFKVVACLLRTLTHSELLALLSVSLNYVGSHSSQEDCKKFSQILYLISIWEKQNYKSRWWCSHKQRNRWVRTSDPSPTMRPGSLVRPNCCGPASQVWVKIAWLDLIIWYPIILILIIVIVVAVMSSSVQKDLWWWSVWSVSSIALPP